MVPRRLEAVPTFARVTDKPIGANASYDTSAEKIVTHQPAIFGPIVPDGVRRHAPEEKIARRFDKAPRRRGVKINIQRVSWCDPAIEIRHLDHPAGLFIEQRFAVEVNNLGL